MRRWAVAGQRREQSLTCLAGACSSRLWVWVISHVWWIGTASSLRPYGEDRAPCLLRSPINPQWLFFLICWRGSVFCASSLQGKIKIHVFLLVRRVLLAAEERKTRVYCFSMRIVHTKHSGVAFELVTVSLWDVIYSNGTSTKGMALRNLISSMLIPREKN